MDDSSARVPVLLITGFLGAGKTTLVNALLRNADGLRIAVLVNEVGGVDIDSQLLEIPAEFRSGLVELKNGCICCTIEVELQDTLRSLLDSHGDRLDYVIIETSGVTNPAPVVFTLQKGELKDRCRFESVITLVNADDLSDETSAGVRAMATYKAQLESADVILLNKTDLCAPRTVAKLTADLTARFPRTFVHAASFGNVPLSILVDHPTTRAALEADTSESSDHKHESETKHSCDDKCHTHDGVCASHASSRRKANHLIADGLQSMILTHEKPVQAWSLARFLRSLPASVFRMKGFAQVALGERIGVVHITLHKAGRRFSLAATKSTAVTGVQLVLIGQNLLVEAWQSRWRAHVVDASEHEPPKLPANEEPCTSCADESKEAKIVHPAGKALSVSTGHDVAGTHSTWQKLKKQVESDHRFFWSETSSDGVAVFGLAGALGFAFVEVSARSELNRELIERVNMCVEPVFVYPVLCPPPEGGLHVAAAFDCRHASPEAGKQVWEVIQREAVPLLTQLFASALCC